MEVGTKNVKWLAYSRGAFYQFRCWFGLLSPFFTFEKKNNNERKLIENEKISKKK
jgi:hypothetical protein